MTALYAARTPWHLWAIGIVSLLWNAMGAMDYVMTQTKNAAYLANFTPEQLAYFGSFPSWVQGSWAIAVFFSVAGSVLLLLRSFWAMPLFAISLIAMLATTFHNYFLHSPKPQEISGTFAIWFSAVIALVSILLYVYSKRMITKRVLR